MYTQLTQLGHRYVAGVHDILMVKRQLFREAGFCKNSYNLTSSPTPCTTSPYGANVSCSEHARVSSQLFMITTYSVYSYMHDM